MSTNKVLPSLQGRRIALAMAADDPISPASELALREGEIFYFPVAQTLPPDGYDDLDELLQRCHAGEVSWLLLTTPCAVEAVAERLAHLELTEAVLTKVKVALYGAKTRLVAQATLPALSTALPPVNSHAEAVAAMALTAQDTVAIPLAQRSRADWATLVEATGAQALVATAYRLILGRGGDDLPGLLWGGLIDAMVFLTENSVRHFVIRLKVEGGSLDMLGDVVVACLDAPTATAAQAYALNVKVVPSTGTFAALAEDLATFLKSEPIQA